MSFSPKSQKRSAYPHPGPRMNWYEWSGGAPAIIAEPIFSIENIAEPDPVGATLAEEEDVNHGLTIIPAR